MVRALGDAGEGEREVIASDGTGTHHGMALLFLHCRDPHVYELEHCEG